MISELFGPEVPRDLLAGQDTLLEALRVGIAGQVGVLDDGVLLTNVSPAPMRPGQRGTMWGMERLPLSLDEMAERWTLLDDERNGRFPGATQSCRTRP